MIWIEENWPLILAVYAVLTATLKLLAMVIPGTKDDEIIVKILDALAKIMSLGGSNVLGEGRVKTAPEPEASE